MKRPTLTKEMIAACAEKFGKENGYDDGEVRDIARVTRSAYLDGYELAKALDDECGWSPSRQDVENLDDFGGVLLEALRQAELAWVAEHNIQPPLPIGTMTTQGKITGVSTYSPACYEILKNGETNPTRRSIVKFENARAAEQGASNEHV
jgi:hypothetical protein